MVNSSVPPPPGNNFSEVSNAIAQDSAADSDRLMRLMNIVFGPIVTPVSSVTGFYFGARTAKEGGAG